MFKVALFLFVFVASSFVAVFADNKCLNDVADFAKKICGEIQTSGNTQLTEANGELKVGISGIVRKVLGEAGVGGVNEKILQDTYEGVLREDLPKVRFNVMECKIKMADKAMSQACIPPPMNPIISQEAQQPKVSESRHYQVLRYRVTKVFDKNSGVLWHLDPPLSSALDTVQVLFWSNGIIKISGDSGAPTGESRTFKFPQILEGLVFELQIDHTDSGTIIKLVLPGQETLYPGAELRVQGIRSLSEQTSQWQLEVESI